jgi:hypothetical protein
MRSSSAYRRALLTARIWRRLDTRRLTDRLAFRPWRARRQLPGGIERQLVPSILVLALLFEITGLAPVIRHRVRLLADDTRLRCAERRRFVALRAAE